MTGQVPNYLSSNFISRGDISSRVSRSSTQLNIPLFKTKSGQRSFYYRTVTLWNALKPHFKLSESLIIFKRKMKAFLLNQLFNVINFICKKFLNNCLSIIFDYFFSVFILSIVSEKPPWGVDNKICIVLYCISCIVSYLI